MQNIIMTLDDAIFMWVVGIPLTNIEFGDGLVSPDLKNLI